MLTDAVLLNEFLCGDDSAFAELVHRHAGMVFGVCQRILGSRQDAEDAFQAVFLVLARQATTVEPAEHLSRWLYGVSRRTALKMRSLRERRKQIEAVAREQSRTAETELPLPENLWQILDEEAARLPKHLLAPFVLCDLEGQTYRDAARQLGLAEGTLSNRLASARRKLSRWLTHRGVTIPSAGLIAMLTPSGTHATAGEISEELFAKTLDVESSIHTFDPIAEGVIRDMAISKSLKVLCSLVAFFFLAFLGLNLIAADEDKALRQLAGEWKLVQAERDGKEVDENELKATKVMISGDTLAISIGGREEKVKINLDASTKPKSIDLIRKKSENLPELGIYELDGNKLKICWDTEIVANTRSKTFTTKQNGRGRLLILERVTKN